MSKQYPTEGPWAIVTTADTEQYGTWDVVIARFHEEDFDAARRLYTTLINKRHIPCKLTFNLD